PFSMSASASFMPLSRAAVGFTFPGSPCGGSPRRGLTISQPRSTKRAETNVVLMILDLLIGRTPGQLQPFDLLFPVTAKEMSTEPIGLWPACLATRPPLHRWSVACQARHALTFQRSERRIDPGRIYAQ